MPLHLVDDEPPFADWQPVGLTSLVDELLPTHARPSGRPAVLAVDGRGASGKSTLADRIAAAVPGTVVVHTDDLAWHEPFFGWGHLLRDVLAQLHEHGSAHLVPPQWPARERQGAVEVPAGTSLVVVEGNAASQRAVGDLLDAVVWVQADFAEAERRGIERDDEQGVNGDHQQTVAFWHEWMGHERAFFRDDRPWERADAVVAGVAVLELDEDEVALSRPGAPASGR